MLKCEVMYVRREEQIALMGADGSVELRKHRTGCGFFTLRRDICFIFTAL